MSGNTNLQAVLSSMKLSCDEITYGFATVKDASGLDMSQILCTFREPEGLTLIASSEFLQANSIPFEGPYAKVTVEVHTSLELVGLTAVLASRLAENQISANVVAAYYHDHIFVQYDLRSKAIGCLASLGR